jgi:glutamate-1-semialdehyde 2,1-aminomutase
MEIATATDTFWEVYKERFPTSLERYNEALGIFPSGITHDVRYFKPFPVYMARADGAYKWDLDGNKFIDCWMGHGALLLGHNHPAIVQAIGEQLKLGTHYSAATELEIAWGRWIQRLMPSAERVCFTNSGTEATLLAIRLARAFKGKNTIVRFQGHFHGWHDCVTLGFRPPFDAPSSLGVPSSTWQHIKCVPVNDIDAVEKALDEDPDVAGVILEPGGALSGTVPTKPGFLAALRELCDAKDIVLIFDEVVTGFRYAPGGAQDHFGVTPDLTALGKIVAGGLPGGATVGRADIMALLEFKDDPHADRYERVPHSGTYNANPVSAAAGVAMLEMASTGEPQRKSAALTEELVECMNQILMAQKVPGCVYGDPSGFHFFFGENLCQPEDANRILDVVEPVQLLTGLGPRSQPVRVAFLLEGIDVVSSGRTSAVHTEADIESILDAFERVLARLRTWDVL